MSAEELIKALNDNFDELNEHQEKRELAIFDRYNQLNSKLDGIKTQLEQTEGRLNDRFSHVNNRIDALEDKLNEIIDQLGGKSSVLMQNEQQLARKCVGF